MKSWLGMVSMLWAGGREQGKPSGQHHVPTSRTHLPHCVVALPSSPSGPEGHLLWLRFSTSMFLALSSSRGHSVSWL